MGASVWTDCLGELAALLTSTEASAGLCEGFSGTCRAGDVASADGLAVGRASGFVGRAMQRLLDGYYTLTDERMFDYLKEINQQEALQLEPSAVTGLLGPTIVSQQLEYQARLGLDEIAMENATHLVWATGGSMVPKQEMEAYLT